MPHKSSRKERAAAPPHEIFTIAPEIFSLPDMVLSPRPFRVQLFRGHFERGGQLIGVGLASVEEIVHFRPLDPRAAPQPQGRGILFGTLLEQHFAHYISGKPDFDQVISVTGLSLGAGSREVSFTDWPHHKPLSLGQELRFTGGGLEGIFQAGHGYLEFGDLSH